MRWRLLAVDIDGTLVNSRDELTPATRDALRRAVAAGVRVLLVTGRQYFRALPLAVELELDAPIVVASGALVKTPRDHATLFRASFEPDLLADVLRLVDGAGYQPVVYTDTFHEGYDYHFPAAQAARPELAEFIELNRLRGRCRPQLVASPPEGVFAGFAMGTREEMAALEADLHRQLPGRLYLHVLRSPRYRGFMCEIAPAGVTKWSGVRRLAAQWGIEDAQICAVGDDVNDLPMLHGAGFAVAMRNAQPQVLAAADRVCRGHDHDGLAEVVSWLLDEDESAD